MDHFFLLLVFVWYLESSESFPTSQSNWKRSRFIIDNRKQILFNKPYFEIYARAVPVEPKCLNDSDVFKKKKNFLTKNTKDFKMDEPAKRNDFKNSEDDFLSGQTGGKVHNHLNGDAVDYDGSQDYRRTKSFMKNSANSRKTKKFEGANYNYASNVLESRKFDEISYRVQENKERMIELISRSKNDIISGAPKTIFNGDEPISIAEEENRLKNLSNAINLTPNLIEEDKPKIEDSDKIITTPSILWKSQTEMSEEKDLMDRSSKSKERHVYETRIETVSYHEEIILNRPAPSENSSRTAWQQKKFHERHQKPSKINNANVLDRNYTSFGKNYGKIKILYKEADKYDRGNLKESRTVIPTAKPDDPSKNKFSFVQEEKNYRKYRVEERTVDGFIVGEYGIVRHDDGSLRGVRYTADSRTNPNIIYQALMKFLSL